MDEPFSMIVTDLKQWCYCPRILWYRDCWPGIRPVTGLMTHGQGAHQAEADREIRRSLRTYGLTVGERFFDLPLADATLGLHGKLDLAIAVPTRAVRNAEVVVVEYKDAEVVAREHFKLQLAAYALLVEAVWQRPVRHGFLYSIPLRRATRVPIAPALRQKVHTAIAAMRQMHETEAMPAAPLNRRPCVTCEFRRFCNDVV